MHHAKKARRTSAGPVAHGTVSLSTSGARFPALRPKIRRNGTRGRESKRPIFDADVFLATVDGEVLEAS